MRAASGEAHARLRRTAPVERCYGRRVLSDDLKKLREELKCSTRELAAALDLDQKTVLAWETGETFPTKRHVTMMEALRKKGPDAIVRAPRGKAKKTGLQLLDEPRLWEVVRKLLEHPELFAQVAKLAEKYSDPASPAK